MSKMHNRTIIVIDGHEKGQRIDEWNNIASESSPNNDLKVIVTTTEDIEKSSFNLPDNVYISLLHYNDFNQNRNNLYCIMKGFCIKNNFSENSQAFNFWTNCPEGDNNKWYKLGKGTDYIVFFTGGSVEGQFDNDFKNVFCSQLNILCTEINSAQDIFRKIIQGYTWDDIFSKNELLSLFLPLDIDMQVLEKIKDDSDKAVECLGDMFENFKGSYSDKYEEAKEVFKNGNIPDSVSTLLDEIKGFLVCLDDKKKEFSKNRTLTIDDAKGILGYPLKEGSFHNWYIELSKILKKYNTSNQKRQ